jgi:hypothetical protein
MKSKEEIEQLALNHANEEIEVYNSIGVSREIKQAIYTHCLVSYNIAYTKCQEDMADKKYTDEDMLGFLNFYNEFDFKKLGYRYRYPSMDGSEKKYNQNIDKKILEEYIKSLNKQD